MHLNDGFIIPRKVLICHMQASEEKMNFFNKLKQIRTVYGILPYTWLFVDNSLFFSVLLPLTYVYISAYMFSDCTEAWESLWKVMDMLGA